MVQHILFKILLAPFSLLYGMAVGLRNQFYRWKLLKGVEFNLPVISVGNLSVGGAGKTPHIEYLIRLLKDYLEVATMSRGYKRKTKGYLTVHSKMNAEQAGDEPLQFKRKFPEIKVSVSESRALGIPMLMSDHPELQAILLDDAFQHRSVKPGLNIMLTEYNHPFTRDYLLPSGRLREWRSAYQRADLIIVSKCPRVITANQAEALRQEIQPLPYQQLYFSYYDYTQPYFIFDPRYQLNLEPDMDVLLICAIARTEYLTDYLSTQVNEVSVMEFEDHHFFTKYDVAQLKESFDRMDAKKKVILTTEKDAMRLELHRPYMEENRMPIFAVPVQVRFHFDQGPVFDKQVQNFLLNFRV